MAYKTMLCPRCGARSLVTATHETDEYVLARERQCGNGHVFNTLEIYMTLVRDADIKRFAEAIKNRWHTWARNREMEDLLAEGMPLKAVARRYRLTPQGVRLGVKAYKAQSVPGHNVDYGQAQRKRRLERKIIEKLKAGKEA